MHVCGGRRPDQPALFMGTCTLDHLAGSSKEKYMSPSSLEADRYATGPVRE